MYIFLRQDFSVQQSWLSWNSLCRPGWTWTHEDPPASASCVPGLKACATTVWQLVYIFNSCILWTIHRFAKVLKLKCSFLCDINLQVELSTPCTVLGTLWSLTHKDYDFCMTQEATSSELPYLYKFVVLLVRNRFKILQACTVIQLQWQNMVGEETKQGQFFWWQVNTVWRSH